MRDHPVTQNQAMLSIVLFNFGSSVVMGVSTGVRQDGLIAILAATLAAVPLLLLYARILALFPGRDLFEIAEALFGKVSGKVITALFVWYAIHLAALVLRNFTEFTQVADMPETPQLPIMILMMLTTAYLAKGNMLAIGKWSIVAFFLVLLVVVLTFGASLKQLRLDALLPLMSHPPAQIAQTAFQVFSFPYAETVLFLCVGNSLSGGKPYKLFMRAILLTFTIFLLVFVRNIVLLGQSMMEINLFPSYVTARIIEVGDFFARVEGLISSNFLLAGIVKISVCLLAASKGLTSLLNAKNHRPMVMPAALLSMALSAVLFENIMGMFAFQMYYPYYALPFQVVIPAIILIAAETRTRKRKAQPAE